MTTSGLILKKMRVLVLVAVVWLGHCLCAAPSERFSLVRDGKLLSVWVEPQADPTIRRAADDLINDLTKVSGLRAKLSSGATPPDGPAILIGQLGSGGLIDQLASRKKLEVAAIQQKWEASVRAVVSNPTPGIPQALVIAGSDPRGTIFAVYEVAEEIGVSPWHWWADVPSCKNPEPTVAAETRVSTGPSIRYRGISLQNASDLQTWAAKTFEPEAGGAGPKTYAQICELLLRLRANTLWPPIGKNTPAFESNPENMRVIDRYGILVGNSPQSPNVFRRDTEPTLSPPPDATILLSDDAFGYLRDLPATDERNHPAGFGIHYHLVHHRPPSPEVLTTAAPPALIFSELSKAYELGARQLWVAEVGNIKSAAISMEFFLRLAFEADRWNATNLSSFLKDWSARTFGRDQADRVAAVLSDYHHLNFQRKPEHLHWGAPLADGSQAPSPFTRDERLARLEAFQRLQADAHKISLAESDAADSFTQLVLFPALASAAANQRFFCAEEYLSLRSSSPGEAEKWAARAQDAHRKLSDARARYNEQVSGGKWRHLFSQTPPDDATLHAHGAPTYVPPGEFTFVPFPEPEERFAKDKLTRPASSFAETDGVIAINAQNFSGTHITPKGSWEIVRGIGRSGAIATPFPRTLTPPTLREMVHSAPRLDYVIHTNSAGDYLLLLETLPTHALTPSQTISVGFALGENLPAILSIMPPQHGTAEWMQSGLSAVRRAQVKLNIATPGRHVLRLYAVDPAIALDKIILIAPKTRVPPSYFGPRETPAPPIPRLTEKAIAERNARLFLPLQGNNAAISPNGRYIAYDVRSGGEVSVIIRPLPLNDTVTAHIVAASDKTTAPSRMYGTEQAAFRWMRWLTDDQFVFQTNSMALFATDPQAKNVRELAPRLLSLDSGRGHIQGGKTTSYHETEKNLNSVWGVDPDDPLRILVHTSLYRSWTSRISDAYRTTEGLNDKDNPRAPEPKKETLKDLTMVEENIFHLHHVVSKDRTKIPDNKARAIKAADSQIQKAIRSTWPSALQELQLNFPSKQIDVVASDPTGRLLAFTVQSLADSGFLGLYDRERATLTEIVRRATEDVVTPPHTSSTIDLTEPDGLRLVATLTLPFTARTKTPPLVVICPPKPTSRALQEYHPEFQALADAGFAVAQIEGYAITNPKEATQGDENAPAELSHLFRVVDRLVERFPLNPRRIAVIGEAHASQLALRAMQSRPQQFRCAVFIDPYTSSSTWSKVAKIRAASSDNSKRPVLLFRRTSRWAIDYIIPLRNNGMTVSQKYLVNPYDRKSPSDVREAFTAIEGFLNEHLYNYEVTSGPVKIIDDSITD